MNNPVVQNFPCFHPTALYAQSGRVGALGISCAAGRRVRIYPGGRKAATATHFTSFFPNFTFFEETKSALSLSQPIGILPGRVKS
jgi:hypothetical protein